MTSYMRELGSGSTSPSASHKSQGARGLLSSDPPMEKSWVCPGVAPAA
jgi:hypothetical protein